MSDSSQSSIDLDGLAQKIDDIEAELEIQSDYLSTIKTLLTVLIILILPIVLFLGYVFYLMMNPRVYF